MLNLEKSIFKTITNLDKTMIENYRMKLKSFQVIEKRQEDIEVEFNLPAISNFNLLISDNAQEKTRLFNIFNFLSNLFSEKPIPISTHFAATINFEIIDHISNSILQNRKACGAERYTIHLRSTHYVLRLRFIIYNEKGPGSQLDGLRLSFIK